MAAPNSSTTATDLQLDYALQPRRRKRIRIVVLLAMPLLAGLAAWFGIEVVTAAGQAGLAERLAGLAQAAWPLAVVLSCLLPAEAVSGTTAYAR